VARVAVHGACNMGHGACGNGTQQEVQSQNYWTIQLWIEAGANVKNSFACTSVDCTFLISSIPLLSAFHLASDVFNSVPCSSSIGHIDFKGMFEVRGVCAKGSMKHLQTKHVERAMCIKMFTTL